MRHLSSPLRGTCTGPTLVGRSLRAFGLGLVALFALAAPAAAQIPVITCNADVNCFDDNPCTADRCLRDPLSALPGVCDYTTPAPADTVCRGAATPGTCDLPETCGGNLVCPIADAVRPAGTVCRPSAGICDVADTCDGFSSACPDAKQPPSFTCREAAGVCDRDDHCDGVGDLCPGDAKRTGEVCRPAAGGFTCDMTEVCNDTSNDCPADQVRPAGFACRPADPTAACDVSETCSGTSADCPTDEVRPAGFVCRPAAGPCDVEETCVGNGATLCPSDQFRPTGATCDDGNACTEPGVCTGVAASCTPGGAVVCNDGNACTTDSCDPGRGCTTAPVSCDDNNACTTDSCNPASGCTTAPVVCPDDGNACTVDTCDPTVGCGQPAPNTTVCRPAAGDCDEAEFCSGTTCPNDAFSPPTETCRSASGSCDVEEKCTGTSAQCPANGFKADGTSCDDGFFCTGPNNTDTCNQGVCSGPANTCSDDNACTSDVCNEDSNKCEQSPDQSASCEGKMTCGGQILGKADKRSFGGNAQGRAQTPPGAAGGAKGHFNYVNHTSGVKVNGPVTFIHYALRTATGGEMRFEVTTREGCKYDVTVRDNSEPGHKPPHDFLKVEYVSGSCPVENTGDQPLTAGNNQWHDR